MSWLLYSRNHMQKNKSRVKHTEASVTTADRNVKKTENFRKPFKTCQI